MTKEFYCHQHHGGIRCPSFFVPPPYKNNSVSIHRQKCPYGSYGTQHGTPREFQESCPPVPQAIYIQTLVLAVLPAVAMTWLQFPQLKSRSPWKTLSQTVTNGEKAFVEAHISRGEAPANSWSNMSLDVLESAVSKDKMRCCYFKCEDSSAEFLGICKIK